MRTVYISFAILFFGGVLSAIVPFGGPLWLAWKLLGFLLDKNYGVRRTEIFAAIYVPLALGVLMGTYFFVDFYSRSTAGAGYSYLVPWMAVFTAAFWIICERLRPCRYTPELGC